MFFPRRLRRPVLVGEFITALNSMNLTGGNLQVVKSNKLSVPSHVIFSAYKDKRCAVSISRFTAQNGLITEVKAVVQDISDIEHPLINNAIGNDVGPYGRVVPFAIPGMTMSLSQKREEAENLAKLTNNELRAALSWLGW